MKGSLATRTVQRPHPLHLGSGLLVVGQTPALWVLLLAVLVAVLVVVALVVVSVALAVLVGVASVEWMCVGR